MPNRGFSGGNSADGAGQTLILIGSDGRRATVGRAIATEASYVLRDLLDGWGGDGEASDKPTATPPTTTGGPVSTNGGGGHSGTPAGYAAQPLYASFLSQQQQQQHPSSSGPYAGATGSTHMKNLDDLFLVNDADSQPSTASEDAMPPPLRSSNQTAVFSVGPAATHHYCSNVDNALMRSHPMGASSGGDLMDAIVAAQPVQQQPHHNHVATLTGSSSLGSPNGNNSNNGAVSGGMSVVPSTLHLDYLLGGSGGATSQLPPLPPQQQQQQNSGSGGAAAVGTPTPPRPTHPTDGPLLPLPLPLLAPIELPFPYFTGAILQKVCRHMSYRFRVSTFGAGADGSSRVFPVKTREIPRPMLLPLADYLDSHDRRLMQDWDELTTVLIVKCATLLNYEELLAIASAKLATFLADRSVEGLRTLLGVDGDFSAAEDAELKKEHPGETWK